LQGAKNNSCNETECDTINVTYASTIRPILQNSCLGCHSGTAPSGGIPLETHSDVLAVVNNGKLLGSIRHEQGYSTMPKGGAKLNDCYITQIEKWINNGAPNN
jgi:mono/diheme cytochrome c family protein